MELREFKKWIIENDFEDNELFQEALVCYCNRAHRAAYMLSYLAFIEYLRDRVLDYKGIPVRFEEKWRNKKTKDNPTNVKQVTAEKWKMIINELNNEDNWDNTLKDIINESEYNIFCYDEKIRREFEVKKNHRNVCAHNKERKITNSTVEDLWDFIAYVKPLSVINGVSEYIIKRINEIIRYSNKEEYKQRSEEIFRYYKELVGEEKKKVFHKVCEQIDLYEFVDSNIFLIDLFELIFQNYEAEENKWITEDKYELFMKVNVSNYSRVFDKSLFYRLIEKYDKDWSRFSNHYSTTIVKNGINFELKKKFLIDMYNEENHYSHWINVLLASNDWNLYIDEEEILCIIKKTESVELILNEIEKLYYYNNGYNEKKTSTFDYCNFRDKISRKVMLILILSMKQEIDINNSRIKEVINRCKKIVNQANNDENCKYMCYYLENNQDVFSWLKK